MTPADEREPTAAIAAFVSGIGDAALPSEVAHAARRTVANWLGCALGGIGDPSVQPILSVALGLGTSPQARVAGRPERLDSVNAALVNGASANALDYDDMHVPTLIHPSGPVVSAALAVAEPRHATGARFLAAIAAGVEVECRIGAALFPAHYDAGWHITATAGTMGAAAAACAAIGLDAPRTAHALGIAATQAGGLRAMLPNPCKSFNIGRAASAGVLAALLAEAGLASEPRVLEAKHGLFDVLGRPADPGALTGDLGRRFVLPQVSLKPYPCGVVIHPLIDACLALSGAHGADVRRIAAVHARVHPRAIDLAGRRHPENAITGRFSLYHAAALALTLGRAGLEAFDGADVRDARYVALRDRTTMEPARELGPGEAIVRIELDDDTRREHVVRHPSGSPQQPLTDAQLEAKFMELARRAVGEAAARALFELCFGIEGLDDVNALGRTWAP